MADGAVLSGIPRHMALKFSAHAVMVSSDFVSTTLTLFYQYAECCKIGT